MDLQHELADFIGDSDTSDGFDRTDMLSFATAVLQKERAERFTIPAQVAGVMPVENGVSVNARGDFLIEPLGDENLRLILVRADGMIAIGHGEWETRPEA